MKFSYTFYLLLVFSLNLKAQNNNKAIESFTYQKNVKSVRLYSNLKASNSFSELPIINLKEKNSLILDFDILNEDYEDYRLKLIHCNADWSVSDLASLNYLSEYNEFNLDNYEYSFNTKVEYINYRFTLPELKQTGNYILYVYSSDNKNQPIFTKRFLVLDNLIEIKAEVLMSNIVRFREEKQRLKIKIKHSKLNIPSPSQQLKISIYQNNKLVTKTEDLKPTRIYPSENTLIYDHFNGENEYWAGNDYRLFDSRSSSFNGIHVRSLKKENRINTNFLYEDSPRTSKFYSQSLNRNYGKYKIENIDSPAEIATEDYTNVVFELRKEFHPNQEIYVIGAFNNWKKQREFKLEYNKESQAYFCSTLMKQGVYDYKYEIKGLENNPLEGEHYNCENIYEIIVYYRGQNKIADEIIGYYKISNL